jgi:hypothetical protein
LFSWFKHVENSVNKCECTGCTSSCHTDKRMEKVHKTDNEDKLSAILEISGRLGLSYGTHQWINKWWCEHAVDFYTVWALFNHWLAESASAILSTGSL